MPNTRGKTFTGHAWEPCLLVNEKERKNTSMTQYYSLPFGKSSIIIYIFSSTAYVLQAVIGEYVVV